LSYSFWPILVVAVPWLGFKLYLLFKPESRP